MPAELTALIAYLKQQPGLPESGRLRGLIADLVTDETPRRMLQLSIEAGVLQGILNSPTQPDGVLAHQYAQVLESKFMMQPEKAREVVSLCVVVWGGVFDQPVIPPATPAPEPNVAPTPTPIRTRRRKNYGWRRGIRIFFLLVALFLIWKQWSRTPENVPEPTIKQDPFAGKMVRVDGGTFQMGDTFGEGKNDKQPIRRITLSSFYMSKYEVTQAQWREVMGNNPSYFTDCDQCPVEQVSWEDIQEFLRKLNGIVGKSYRLPTEAEWEYAARGGRQSRGYKYSGSNNVDEFAWHRGNSGSKTRPVGTKKANELGLYDMSGNVWEWCSDWFGAYPSTAQTNPKGPSKGSNRVIRGGGWNDDPHNTRVAIRGGNAPTLRYRYLGFRLALSL